MQSPLPQSLRRSSLSECGGRKRHICYIGLNKRIGRSDNEIPKTNPSIGSTAILLFGFSISLLILVAMYGNGEHRFGLAFVQFEASAFGAPVMCLVLLIFFSLHGWWHSTGDFQESQREKPNS